MNISTKKQKSEVYRSYLKDVSRIPLLTLQEETELIKKAKAGDKLAREKLLSANLRFVIMIAKRYTGLGLEFCDLISEGNIGLMVALDHYEIGKSARFTTYAAYWIKQVIIRAINCKADTIRVPSRGYDRIKVLSLDDPIKNDDREKTKVAFVSDKKNKSPEEQLVENDIKQAIDSGIDILREKEKLVIKMRYGLDGKEGMSLLEIGEKLNLSKERIRQIEEAALSRLYRYYSSNKKVTP